MPRSLALPIRHNIRSRVQARGITPRRLAAAKRALKRERNCFPLFADQVASEQPTPEERVQHFDDFQTEYEQGFRDLAAKHWRWGRRQLSLLSAETRAEILNHWNISSIPAHAEYFADFVRRKIRSRGLPIVDA